ncbi:response regulator [Arcticibacterium luteifluviistationis]|uniref:DNA-binding response regulator n=1 Tax=Arcticibacterium luteifluviistationis TaxID=1784714 RepID=A0A2Z4GDY2_9BACT|nr:response regulator transcription factor [Arcticibacterium luteifluviistationis]AWV99492.1 DNA-binding response regulator [Arcticibacterium luteifluviistationis]
MKTVCLIDDDKIVTDSVSSFLAMHEDIKVTGIYHSAEDFLSPNNLATLQYPSILILDVGLPGISGIEAITPIKAKFPDLDIIMLTTYEEEDIILKAIYNGACSYVSKKAGLMAILDAIKIVGNGGSYMSPAIAREIFNHLSPKKNETKFCLPDRQFQILKSLVEGMTYVQIAKDMNISVETVRSHIKRMYKKLHVGNKTEAISKFMKGEIS